MPRTVTVTADEVVVRLAPERAEARCNLGAALASVGRLTEALRHYEIAVRLAPGLPEARAGRDTLRAQLDGPQAQPR